MNNEVKNLTMVLAGTLLLAACGAVPTPSAQAGQLTAQRGGGGGGGGVPTIPTSAGPCPTEFVVPNGGNGVHYPLEDPRYPGWVGVDMVWDVAAGLPITATNVCLDPGWSVVPTSVSGGVQLRFFYNSQAAIDFTYKPGTTRIKHL